MTNTLNQVLQFVPYLQTAFIAIAASPTSFKSWEFGGRLRRVSLIETGKKLYSMTGFEKISKAMIANIELISRLLPEMGKALKPMLKCFTAQKDLIYGTMFIDNTAKLISRDEKSGSIKFRMPGLIEGLQLIGAYCDAGKFLQKQEIYSFESCTKLAEKMGKFEVYGVKPFEYRPLASLTERPKDFFIFIASLLDLTFSIKRFILPSSTDLTVYPRTFAINTKLVREYNRKRELSIDNLLKQVGNIGKMYLICMGSQANTLAFAVVNFITQNASLLSFVIKK